MRRPPFAVPSLLALCLVLVLALAGCGGESNGPVFGQGGDSADAAKDLGFPTFATKNTTRVAGADAVADAAAVAQAVYPGEGPDAVALADAHSWQAALAASALMAPPVGAPLLLTEGTSLPDASESALAELKPTGSPAAGGGQVIRVGDVAKPDGLKSTDLKGGDPAETAAGVDRFLSAATGQPSRSVIVVSQSAPQYAMPAAGLAAKTGTPILYVTRDAIPAATRTALHSHAQPRIYVLGPTSAVSSAVLHDLKKLGSSVTRIKGEDPVSSAVAFARFDDGAFGWGVTDPGHGIVFASGSRPLDAAAAAPLSASGQFGPLLLVEQADELPKADASYLLDIQPGYTKDPVRGVYNHGWLIGDESAISTPVQARIDGLLEIVPVKAPKR